MAKAECARLGAANGCFAYSRPNGSSGYDNGRYGGIANGRSHAAPYIDQTGTACTYQYTHADGSSYGRTVYTCSAAH
ncbi:MAG: hypothetical protein Kow0080_06850 [Candidatus Promineifilaceae bacterium]